MSTKEEPGVEEPGVEEPVDATVALPMADAGELEMKDQEKQGGKCCFFCCDYRRAVVVISILQMLNSLVWLVLFAGAGGWAVVGSLETQGDDDYDYDYTSEALISAAVGSYILAAMYGFFFLCNIFVLCAALRYSVCMLSTTIIIVLIQFGFSIWNVVYRAQYSWNPTTQYVVGIIGSIIGYGVYLYPIIGLTSEIRNGTMSRETYPREAYSCCCTPKF